MRAWILLGGLLLGCWPLTQAADRTFTIVTNAAVLNHWPGADGFIGTADDVVNPGLSTYERSSPNQEGSYSYLVTTLGQTPADPWLFGSYNTVTYLRGSVTIDPTQFVGANVPLLKALEFSGTELFPGHGAYSVKLTSRRGGSTTKTGNVFHVSVQFDFQGTFTSSTATSTNSTATGLVVLLDPDQYDSPDLTGAPDALANYVKTVAIPLARANSANGLVCGTMDLQTAGSILGVPGDTGYFPPLLAYGVVIGLDLSLSITEVRFTPAGLQLNWSPVSGQTYSVQATSELNTPFTTIASHLSQPQYVDHAAQGVRTRFYRVTAP